MVELLYKEKEKVRKSKIYFGNTTDIYMPIERKLAPFITKRAWIASMNHKELNNDLFRRHFPEWLDGQHVERVMAETRQAFESRGVTSFYSSLPPVARRNRWTKREAKINERKNKISEKTVKLLSTDSSQQPSLFD